MTSSVEFTPDLASKLSTSQCHFVITGANGWMGKVTLDMLHRALGHDADSRISALGSRSGDVQLANGKVFPVKPLTEFSPPKDKKLVIFHYAFLTKDKVSGLSSEEYVAGNESISKTVRKWIYEYPVLGVIMPSSGAVYDFLNNTARDPAARIYGQLKYNDEQTFSALCDAKTASLIIPRLFNLSGPYINKFDSYALASFITQVFAGNPITVLAKKPVLRSYYYAGDLLELCLRLLFEQHIPHTEIFDVAGEETVELGQLAQRVAAVLKDHSPAITPRMTFPEDVAEDRYVGNRNRIQYLENKVSVRPTSLDAQIAATSRYIADVIKESK